MSAQNPYAPPTAQVADPVETDAEIQIRMMKIARAQKYAIYSVLAQIVSPLLATNVPYIGIAFALVTWLASIACALWLATVIGRPLIARIFIVIGMFIPLVSLLLLLTLNVSATSQLRKGGWKVGLMGARPRTV